jgi:hypothetical protein
MVTWGADPRLLPLIVTIVPTAPDCGAKLVIEGPAGPVGLVGPEGGGGDTGPEGGVTRAAVTVTVAVADRTRRIVAVNAAAH